jgi:hypothetical protein
MFNLLDYDKKLKYVNCYKNAAGLPKNFLYDFWKTHYTNGESLRLNRETEKLIKFLEE